MIMIARNLVGVITMKVTSVLSMEVMSGASAVRADATFGING